MLKAFFEFLGLLTLAIFNAWISHRVARIFGHWEFGVLVFWLFGYLTNAVLYLRKILERLERMGSRLV